MLRLLAVLLLSLLLSAVTATPLGLPEAVAAAVAVDARGGAGVAWGLVDDALLAMGGLWRLYALWRLRRATAGHAAHRRAPMRDFRRVDWQETILEFLTPTEFRQAYGLSVQAFDALIATEVAAYAGLAAKIGDAGVASQADLVNQAFAAQRDMLHGELH